MSYRTSLPTFTPHYPSKSPTPPSFSSPPPPQISQPSYRNFRHRHRLNFHNDPQSQSHSLPHLPSTSVQRSAPVSRVAHVPPPSSSPTPSAVAVDARRTEPKGILRPPPPKNISRNNSPARVSSRRVSFASDTKLAERQAEAAAAEAEPVNPAPEPHPARRRFLPGGHVKERKFGMESIRKPKQREKQKEDEAEKEEQPKDNKKGKRSLFGIGPRRAAPSSVPTERLGRRKQKQEVPTGSGSAGGTRRRNRTS